MDLKVLKGLILIFLVWPSCESATRSKAMKDEYDCALTHAFELFNSTCFTPRSVEELEQTLEHIAVIQSVPFLIWIQGIQDRIAILEQLLGLQITGTSKSQVEKLLGHAVKSALFTQAKQLNQDVETGEFIFKLSRSVKSHLAFPQFGLSRSIIRNMTANLQESGHRSPTDYWDFPLNIQDLYEGILEGDVGDITLAIGAVLGNLVDMLAEFKKLSHSMGAMSGVIGVVFSVISLVIDIQKIVDGNMNGLEIAILVISITSSVITIAAVALSAFPIVGQIAFVISVIFTVVTMILEGLLSANLGDMVARDLDRYLNLSEKELQEIRDYAAANGGEIPEEYLEKLKEANAYLSVVNMELSFLQKPKNINYSRVVYPMLDYRTEDFYPDSEIDLSIKRDVVLDLDSEIWLFDSGTGAGSAATNHVFCPPVMGNCANQEENLNSLMNLTMACQRVNTYYCKYAVGAEELSGPGRGDKTLINLMDGNDVAFGALATSNFFLVGSGNKRYRGGNSDDQFFINSTSLTGELDGGSGKNTVLVFANDSIQVRDMKINLFTEKLDFGNGNGPAIKGFPVVLGRPGFSDIISPGCSTSYIAGQGGSSFSNRDVIQVSPEPKCNFNVYAQIEPFTFIDNGGQNGLFYYSMSSEALETRTDVYIHSTVNSTHVFSLGKAIDFVRDLIVFPNNTMHLNTTGATSDTTLISIDSSIVLTPGSTEYFEPMFLLEDDVTIRIDKDRIPTTIFNLATQKPSPSLVEAPLFGRSIFLIHTDVDIINGGPGDDTFYMNATSFVFKIDGQIGNNRMIMNSTYFEGSDISMELNDQSTGFMCVGPCTAQTQARLMNMQEVFGREGEVENIGIGCGTFTVAGFGGSGKGAEDTLTVLAASCVQNRSAVLVLGPHTIVTNLATTGTYMYITPFADTIEFGSMYHHESPVHTFQLNSTLVEIVSAVLDDEKGSVRFEHQAGGSISVPVQFDDTEDFAVRPNILTLDSSFLKINRVGAVTAISNCSNLKEDVLDFRASLYFENIILVTKNMDNVYGGDNGNKFILYDNVEVLSITGGSGEDGLVLDEGFQNHSSSVHVDFSTGTIDVDGQQVVGSIQSVESFIGRNGSSESVLVTCKQTRIDGLGGSELDFDKIEFENSAECGDNLTIVAHRKFTKISPVIPNWKLAFLIDENLKNHTFDYVDNEAEQSFLLPVPIGHFSEVSLDQADNLVFMLNDGNFSRIKMVFNKTDPDTYQLKPDVFSKDKLQFLVNSKGQVTVRIIADVNTTSGAKGYNNEIIISNFTFETLSGGDLNNTFFLISKPEEVGLIDGTGAISNRLVLDRFNGSITVVSNAEITDKYTADLLYSQVQILSGRQKQQDIFILDCSVDAVNGRGGESDEAPDILMFPKNDACSYEMKIGLNEFTVVESSAQNGTFYYQLFNSTSDEDPDKYVAGNYHINCNNCSQLSTSHTFIVQYPSTVVVDVTSDNFTCSVGLEHIDKSVSTFSLTGNITTCYFPRIIFSDGVFLEVSRIGVRRISHSTSELNATQVYDTYLPYAEPTTFNASVKVLTNETLVNIGRNSFDFLMSSQQHESHLWGNGGENLYMINRAENSSQRSKPVFIHLNDKPGSDGNMSAEMVDLSQYVKPIREKRIGAAEPLFLPTLTITESDELVLEIEDTEGILGVTVTLFSWRVSLLQFIFGANAMRINCTTDEGEDEKCILSPIPVQLTNETFISLDLVDYEDNSEIVLGKPLLQANMSLAVLKGNSSDLVVTNLLSSETTDSNSFTLLVKNFDDETRRSSKSYPRSVMLKFADDAVISFDEVLSSVDKLLLVDEVELELEQEIESDVFSYHCLNAGSQPNYQDCSSYFWCVDMGGKYVSFPLKCPEGSIFCRESMLCDTKSEACSCTALNLPLFDSVK